MKNGVRAYALLASGLTLAACGSDVTPPPTPEGPEVLPPDWELQATPGEVQLLGVWGRTSTDAFAVGWDGAVLRYDGAWRRETSTATVPLTDVGGSLEPEGPIFAVGWGGTIVMRDAEGRWAPAPKTSTTTADLFGLHLSAPDLGYAVGDSGTVLRWDGLTWSDAAFFVTSELSGQPVAPRTALAGVYSADGRRWYFSGAGGGSFRSTDGGQTFEALDTRESVPLRGVWGPSGGSIYTVGLEGVVLRFDNRWRRENPNGSTRFLFGVWGASGSDVTVVGWSGTALRRFGGQWFTERTGTTVDLRDVWVDAETSRAFAVGARGTILTRTSTAPRMPEEES